MSAASSYTPIHLDLRQKNGSETVYPTPKSTTISRHLRSSPSIEFPEKLSATITGLATPSTAPRPKPKPRPVSKPMSPLKGKGRVTAVRSPTKPAYTVKAWALPTRSMIKEPDDDMDVIEVSSGSDSERDEGRISLQPISTLHDNHDNTRSEPHIRTSSPLTPVPSSRSPSEDVQRPVTTPEPVMSPTTSTSDSYIATPTQLRFVPSSQPTQDYGRKYPDPHIIESETESESDWDGDDENPFAARRGDNRPGGGGGVGSTANSKAYHLPKLSSPPQSSSSQAASVFTPAPESRHHRPPTSVSGLATVAGPSTSPFKVPRIPTHSDRIWSSPGSRKCKDEDLEVIPSSQTQSQHHYLTIPRDHDIASPERKTAPGINNAPIQITSERGNSSQHPIDWYEVVPSSQSQEIEMQLPEGWYERQQAQAVPVAGPSSSTSPPKGDPMDVHLASPDVSPIRPSSLPQPSSSQDSYSSIDIPHLHSTPPPPSLKPASKTHSYSASQDRSLSSSAKRKLQIRDINLHHADLSNFASDSQPQRKLVGEQQEDSETEEESEEDEEGQYHVYPAPPEMTPTPPSPPRRSISPAAARASPSSLEAINTRSPRPTDPSPSKIAEAGPSNVTTTRPPRTPTSPSIDAEARMRHKLHRSLVRYTAQVKARAGTHSQSQFTQSHSQSQFSQFSQSSQSEVDSKPKFDGKPKPKFDLKAEMKLLGLDLDNDLDMTFDSQLALAQGGFSIPEDMEMLELSDDDYDDEGEREEEEEEEGGAGIGICNGDEFKVQGAVNLKEVMRRVESSAN